MITRIPIGTVENAFCNATDNSWRYEMILDRRLLHSNPKYSIPISFYETMQFDMHQRLINDTETYMRILINEIT